MSKPKKAKQAKPPAPSKERVCVFVYGTLKRGFPLNQWMEGAKFLGVETVEGMTLLSFGAYPAMYPIIDPAGYIQKMFSVSGECWSMPKNYFESLQQMEERVGYSTVDVTTSSGIKAKAFVYDVINVGTVRWTEEGTVAPIEVEPDDLPF